MGCRVLSVDSLVAQNNSSHVSHTSRMETRSLTGSPVSQPTTFPCFGCSRQLGSPWPQSFQSDACSSSSNSLTSRSPVDQGSGDDIASLQSLIKGIASEQPMLQRPTDAMPQPVFSFPSPLKAGGTSPVAYSPPFLDPQTLVPSWYSHGCRELAYHGHPSSTLYPVCM